MIIGAMAASGGTAYTIHEGVNRPDIPDPMEVARQQLSAQKRQGVEAAKGAIPGARAELASRGITGASPEFIAGQVGAEAGAPEQYEEILEMVRQLMSGRGGGGFNA